MKGYLISDLKSNVQDLIKEKKLDKNHNNHIDIENGELQELLSATGKTKIGELAKKDFMDIAIGSAFGLGTLTFGNNAYQLNSYKGLGSKISVGLSALVAIGCGVLSGYLLTRDHNISPEST